MKHNPHKLPGASPTAGDSRGDLDIFWGLDKERYFEKVHYPIPEVTQVPYAWLVVSLWNQLQVNTAREASVSAEAEPLVTGSSVQQGVFSRWQASYISEQLPYVAEPPVNRTTFWSFYPKSIGFYLSYLRLLISLYFFLTLSNSWTHSYLIFSSLTIILSS